MNVRSCAPEPQLLIKSLSEQGYTLATAIADLIDNSVSAGASCIELLLDSSTLPFRLFIADNGHGMDSETLVANMRFPSADVDAQRKKQDMGRFGLGLKTASFSQARKFSVISKIENKQFNGCTWDVDYLKETGEWTLILNGDEEIADNLNEYRRISKNFHGYSADFEPKTVVIWDNLYKLQKFAKKNEVNEELDDLRSHLGLVFHRYILSGKIAIRLNNQFVDGFDPFPATALGVQTVAEKYWQTEDAYIRFQGIILPKRSVIEINDANSPWVPHNRTLEELQGIYVYRNDRLINYGGWLKTIAKSIYLQFGRIKIDIGNTVDHEFHLNVAKSSLKIPFGLKRAMADMVKYVAGQAAREYRDRLASGIVKTAGVGKGVALIVREIGASGVKLKINQEFEILRRIHEALGVKEQGWLDLFLTLVENKLNDVWKGDSDHIEVEAGLSSSLKDKIKRLEAFYSESGYSWQETKTLLFDSFGRGKNETEFIESLKN